MDGVRVISSVAVFLFVLLASFSAAREERSTRANWQTANAGDSKYVALLTVNAKAVCSGSIPSKWTVLTLCATASAGGDTKAYAGVLKVAEATPTAGGNIQVRDVTKVAEKEEMTGLKICTLNEIWDFNEFVGSVPVSASEQTECTVLGFGIVASGGRDGEKRIARKQSATLVTTNCDGVGKGVLGSSVTAADTEKLEGLDFGGPLVCDGVQRGISKEYKSTANKMCNLYIAIADHSDWIEKEIQAADPEAPAGPDGTGGTGGNGTASSGYSIHSHLNKYSNWKVLWFLVPPIVTFLQY